MNKFQKRNFKLIVFALAIWLNILLTLSGFPYISSNRFTPLTLLLTVVSTLLVITFLSIWIVKKGLAFADKAERKSTSPALLKFVACLLVAAIATTLIAAYKSFWYAPSAPNYGLRFIFENTAIASGFVSIALLFLLNFLHRDVYTFYFIKKREWDERELKQRYEIAEQSYKIAILLMIVCSYTSWLYIGNIPEIIRNNYGAVPGGLLWIPASVGILLAAIPPVLAAWKNKP